MRSEGLERSNPKTGTVKPRNRNGFWTNAALRVQAGVCGGRGTNPHTAGYGGCDREGESVQVPDYYRDGSVELEMYWLDGERHRDDGPAVINYYQGRVLTKRYYLNGEQVTCSEVNDC